MIQAFQNELCFTLIGDRPRMLFFIRYTVTLGIIAALAGIPSVQAVAGGTFPKTLPNILEGSTKVSIGIYVIDIKGINDVTQSFTVDFFLVATWTDPRLASDVSLPVLSKRRFDLKDIWNPKIDILNDYNLSKKYDDVVEIDSDGLVMWHNRYHGELSISLDLQDYPLDKHQLPISVASFGYSPDEVEFIVDEFRTGQTAKFSIAGWTLRPGQTQIHSEYFSPQDRSLTRLDYEISAERNMGYFLWKVILPLVLIVAMSWCAFFIDPSDLGPQLGIASTSVLTVIAHQLSLGSIIPRISYLTRGDQFVLGSVVLVFLALGEAITTSWLSRKDDHSLAIKIDIVSRIGFPISYALIIIFSFFI